MYNYGICFQNKYKEIYFWKKKNTMNLLLFLRKVLSYFQNKNNLKLHKVKKEFKIWIGMVLTRQERFEEAIDYFKKAL